MCWSGEWVGRTPGRGGKSGPFLSFFLSLFVCFRWRVEWWSWAAVYPRDLAPSPALGNKRVFFSEEHSDVGGGCECGPCVRVTAAAAAAAVFVCSPPPTTLLNSEAWETNPPGSLIQQCIPLSERVFRLATILWEREVARREERHLVNLETKMLKYHTELWRSTRLQGQSMLLWWIGSLLHENMCACTVRTYLHFAPASSLHQLGPFFSFFRVMSPGGKRLNSNDVGASVWRRDTRRGPWPLISGVTEVKGGCVQGEDSRTTRWDTPCPMTTTPHQHWQHNREAAGHLRTVSGGYSRSRQMSHSQCRCVRGF